MDRCFQNVKYNKENDIFQPKCGNPIYINAKGASGVDFAMLGISHYSRILDVLNSTIVFLELKTYACHIAIRISTTTSTSDVFPSLIPFRVSLEYI